MTTSHYHRNECRAFVLCGDFIISQFKISYCDKFALYLQSSYYALMSSSSLSTLSKPADLITLDKLGSSTAKVSWAETSSLFPWRLAVAVSVWYVCVCLCVCAVSSVYIVVTINFLLSEIAILHFVSSPHSLSSLYLPYQAYYLPKRISVSARVLFFPCLNVICLQRCGVCHSLRRAFESQKGT